MKGRLLHAFWGLLLLVLMGCSSNQSAAGACGELVALERVAERPNHFLQRIEISHYERIYAQSRQWRNLLERYKGGWTNSTA